MNNRFITSLKGFLITLSLASTTITAQDTGEVPYPKPGTTGNADNIPFIGKRDADGNPVRLARKTGHVSNYDEAKVKDYSLPDPLISSDGKPVKTPGEWWHKRRSEIQEFYQAQIYGRIPSNAPNVSWNQVSIDNEGTRLIEGRMGTSPDAPRIRVNLTLPKDISKPVPVLLNLSFFGVDRQRTTVPGRFDSRSAVLEHGWAFAHVGYGDIQPDRADHWKEGVIGQTLKESQSKPEDHEWGTISAWAWGASRIIDYLETLDNINATRISITGASRLGKTALWAAAQDQRIAAVFSIVPGEMGASLIRRDWGETLDDMAQNFSWQFAGNLQRWVGKWDKLPVDQHMLISLIAPRPIYINGGISDQWSDPKGEFLAMVGAGPVYRLLGAEDLGTTDVPELDQPVISSHMAFHYHSKGHQSVPEDWKLFLDFAQQHFTSRTE